MQGPGRGRGKARCRLALVFWLQSDFACLRCCLQEVVQTFVQYLYEDTLDVRTEPGHAVVVLHLGHYYGATRLVGLCEGLLAKAFKAGDPEDEGGCAAEADTVPSLLLATPSRAGDPGRMCCSSKRCVSQLAVGQGLQGRGLRGCRRACGSSRPCVQSKGQSRGWRVGLHVLHVFGSRASALRAKHIPAAPALRAGLSMPSCHTGLQGLWLCLLQPDVVHARAAARASCRPGCGPPARCSNQPGLAMSGPHAAGHEAGLLLLATVVPVCTPKKTTPLMLLGQLMLLACSAETNVMAAQLLALADEAGLQRLRNVCLDYIAHHYSKVASTQASGTSTAGLLCGKEFTGVALL